VSYTLHLGDCLEIMKTMADKSVDLVITSPPYNLGDNHHTGNRRHNPYADDMPEAEYQEWQIEVLTELHRIVADGGSVLYNHKNRIKDGATLSPYSWLLRTPWVLKQELVWFNRSQNFDKVRFYPMTERVYWLAKSPSTKLVNVINRHDVFHWQATGTNAAHTRAFPEQMVAELLACFPDARTVLDPYMGSGTVGVVCHKHSRSFVGIELNPAYHAIAQRRIEDAAAQPLLFEVTA